MDDEDGKAVEDASDQFEGKTRFRTFAAAEFAKDSQDKRNPSQYRSFVNVIASYEFNKRTSVPKSSYSEMRAIYNEEMDKAFKIIPKSWKRKRRVDELEEEIDQLKKRHKVRIEEVKEYQKEELNGEIQYYEDCKYIADGKAHHSLYKGNMRKALKATSYQSSAKQIKMTPVEKDWSLIDVYRLMERAMRDPVLHNSIMFQRNGFTYYFLHKHGSVSLRINNDYKHLPLHTDDIIRPGPVEQKGRCFGDAYHAIVLFRKPGKLAIHGEVPREWFIRLCLLLSVECDMDIPRCKFQREQLLTVALYDINEFFHSVKIALEPGLLELISDYNDDWSLV